MKRRKVAWGEAPLRKCRKNFEFVTAFVMRRHRQEVAVRGCVDYFLVSILKVRWHGICRGMGRAQLCYEGRVGEEFFIQRKGSRGKKKGVE
jgi:hypothetical protein